jgi:hypothetical protein
VSGVDRAYGLIKSVMLMGERFDAIDRTIEGLSGDLSDLGKSHAELAQRVARIEGVMEGYARASASSKPARRLPKT